MMKAVKGMLLLSLVLFAFREKETYQQDVNVASTELSVIRSVITVIDDM